MERSKQSGTVDKSELEQFIQRIERLDEERKNISEDIKDIKAEAKSRGFDIKALNQVLKLRAMDQDDRTDLENAVDTYKLALGL